MSLQGLIQGLVLEGARHSLDFFFAGSDLHRYGSPCGCRRCHLLHNLPRFFKGEGVIIGRGLKQINRAGAFFEIDICREHPGFEVGRNGVQVIGW